MPLARGGQLDHGVVDSFIGELEAAEVRADGYPRLEIEVRPHRFFRIHVLRGHEPARLVRADRQQCEVDDAESAADVAKVPPISGIARKEKRPVGRSHVKSAPQRAVAVPAAAPRPMLCRSHRDGCTPQLETLPPIQLLDPPQAQLPEKRAIAEARDEERVVHRLQLFERVDVEVVVVIV